MQNMTVTATQERTPTFVRAGALIAGQDVRWDDGTLVTLRDVRPVGTSHVTLVDDDLRQVTVLADSSVLVFSDPEYRHRVTGNAQDCHSK